MNRKITAMYFSPTGTTRRIATAITESLARCLGDAGRTEALDFTLPAARTGSTSFSSDDTVVFGVPVYAGRVPNILLNFLRTVSGGGASAVAVTVYGNRNYDDALVELSDILEEQGFRVIAAGAFIGEHAFSSVLAAGRPDADDLSIADSFAGRIAALIAADMADQPDPGSPPQAGGASAAVKGCRPYRPYYVPKDAGGEPVRFTKIKPLTAESCTRCGLCANICPLGSIEHADVSVVSGICIKCCACIKKCPAGAKYFDDPVFILHKKELEIQFADRREPELFFGA